MSGRVLIIEDDEWVATLLGKYLRDRGYEVDQRGDARGGFERALSFVPDCIVCDVTLPDIDGLWVARKVRMEGGRIAGTPFLFLTNADDLESHLQALNVGADAYLTKPFRHQEVVAQIAALIGMAERLRGAPDSLGPASSLTAPALRGDTAEMSIATILSILEMERRSGRLKMRRAGQSATLEIADGRLARATLDERPCEPLAAVRTVLAWRDGRFWFRPAAIEGASDSAPALGMLMLEASRLDDEARDA
ncbi:MAG: response regulator [Polyangiaceae bacterium]|nr:response regulator [Polyangiaceae bacterium]